MTFDDLFNIVNEEHSIVEENFNLSQIVKLLALASTLGISDMYTVPKLKDIVDDFRQKSPEQYNTVIEPQAQKKAKLVLDNPTVVNQIKPVINTPQALKYFDKAVETIINNPPKITKPSKEKAVDFLSKAKQYIEKNENNNLKIRNKLYRDNKGYPTIGIGHLVLKSDIADGVLQKGEYTLNSEGDIIDAYISNKRAIEIFNLDLQKKVNSIKRYFPNFDKFPLPLRIVLLDGYFRGDIAGSPNTKALIKRAVNLYLNGDVQKAKHFLSKASDEYLDSAEYRTSKQEKSGIHKRMSNNASVIKHAFDDQFPQELLSKSVYDV